MGKYFSIEELTRSDVATDRRIDNTPPLAVEICLGHLINLVLDPVREAWGKPITVTSGYRCPALNATVGGVRNSDHMEGGAADVTTGNKHDNEKLFALIKGMQEKRIIEFDQLIDEKGYQWLHVSYRGGGNRNQILHL